MTNVLIITDLDNTLFNWIDYFAPSFRAMIHYLLSKTELSEEILLEDFKKIYDKYGSIEFSQSVQNLDHIISFYYSQRVKLATDAYKIFVRVSRKYLEPYAGVLETLSWAYRSGIKIICITTAPINLAENRIMSMSLSKYIIGLGGRKNDWMGKEFVGRSSKRIYWQFNEEQLFPKRSAYSTIMSKFKLSPKSIYVIGDSIENDVKPAIDLGMFGIWARYGNKCSEKNIMTINKISTYKKDRTNLDNIESLPVGTISINKFSDIQSVINNPPQLSLNGFAIY